MTRIAIVHEYCGARYHGWQYQNLAIPTIQMSLEGALSEIAGGEPIRLSCAGRTDAGVHASAQVAHFDTEILRARKAWVEGANTLLPADIAIKWAKEVPDEFHARFSATSRRYRYLIFNGPERNALINEGLTWFRYSLNEVLMQEAGQFLLGEHDFEAFRGSGCQSKSSHRLVSDIAVTRIGEVIQVDIEANAFLLHMVRNIVGALLEVGQENRPPEWVKQVLESKDRTKAGVTASAKGLYLVKVKYPEEFGIREFPAPDFSFSNC